MAYYTNLFRIKFDKINAYHMKCIHSIVGGTFDHFHIGHERLISEICKKSEKVTIGLVVHGLAVKKKYAHALESYSVRKSMLVYFLKKHNWDIKTSIIPLFDIFGTALSDLTIQALFMTKDTRRNAILVNEKRRKIGLSKLTLIQVPFVRGSDGKRISSERIRLGQIDRKGNNWSLFFRSSGIWNVPNNLRKTLQKPLGKVHRTLSHFKKKGEKTPFCLVSVGDVITSKLLQNGIQPDVSIIDFRTRREVINTNKYTDIYSTLVKYQKKAVMYSCRNKAGTVSKSAVSIIKKSIEAWFKTKKPQCIVVNGEEDLLVLPLILTLPLQSEIMYGQFKKGYVKLIVTESLKLELLKLLFQYGKS